MLALEREAGGVYDWVRKRGLSTIRFRTFFL